MSKIKTKAKFAFIISFLFVIEAVMEIDKLSAIPYLVGFVSSIAFDVYMWKYGRAALLKRTDANRSRLLLDANLILEEGVMKVHYVHYILQIIASVLFVGVILLLPTSGTAVIDGALSQMLIAVFMLPIFLIKALEKEHLI